MLRIPAPELERIRVHAAEAFPEEACGFLLGRAGLDGAVKEVVEARPARNEKRDERERRYLIEPAQLLAAEEEALARGLDVIGFYHSHPSGNPAPSEFDRAHAWPWYSYLVVGVQEGRAVGATSSRLAEDRSRWEPEDLHAM